MTPALSILRSSAPLEAPDSPSPSTVPPVLLRGERERLPDRREKVGREVAMDGFAAYVDVAYYPDGRLGEVFIDAAKPGAVMRGVCSALAHAVSLGLQYGVPAEEFVEAFAHTRFGNEGVVHGQPDLERATSPLDAIARVLAAESDIAYPAAPRKWL